MNTFIARFGDVAGWGYVAIRAVDTDSAREVLKCFLEKTDGMSIDTIDRLAKGAKLVNVDTLMGKKGTHAGLIVTGKGHCDLLVDGHWDSEATKARKAAFLRA